MASLAAAFASSSTDCRLKKTLNRNRKLLFICMVWNHSCTTTPVCVTGFAFAKLLAGIWLRSCGGRPDPTGTHPVTCPPPPTRSLFSPLDCREFVYKLPRDSVQPCDPEHHRSGPRCQMHHSYLPCLYIAYLLYLYVRKRGVAGAALCL